MKTATKSTPEQQELLLGKAYNIIPRQILQWLFNPFIEQKQRAILLLALICYGYHNDGYRHFQGVRMECKRGEFIGSYTQLTAMTGMTRYAVKKAMEQLHEQGLITLEKVHNGWRIRFDAYLQFLDQYPHRDWKKANQSAPPAAPANPYRGLRFPSEKQLRIVDEINNQHHEQK